MVLSVRCLLVFDVLVVLVVLVEPRDSCCSKCKVSPGFRCSCGSRGSCGSSCVLLILVEPRVSCGSRGSRGFHSFRGS